MNLYNFDLWEYIENIVTGSGSAAYSIISGFGNFYRIVMAILMVIGMWKMFAKAGENDWGALIPFYNRYLLFKIADMKNWFWAYLGISIFYVITLVALICALMAAFFSSIAGSADYDSILTMLGASMLICFILAILTFALNLARNIKLAKNFNLSGWFVVGFIFFPGIFFMIVGCSEKIHFKDRLPNGLQPGQMPYNQPQGAGSATYDPYAAQGTQGAQQNMYGANGQYGANNGFAGNDPYGAQNNPYGAQNVYSQNAYGQSANGQNNSASDSYAPAKGARDEEVWKTIYDENANNL